MGTPFHRFAKVCDQLAGTASRNAKVDLAAEFLAELDPDERGPGARFLAGRPLARVDARKLDVGHALLEDAGGHEQATLTGGQLTIRGLAGAIDELAGLEGSGSRRRRRAIVDGLVGRLDEGDRPWLISLFQGELRTGVQEGLVLEAVAQAAGAPEELVRRALLRGDVGEVAHLAIDGGVDVLESVDLDLGRPIAPMLAGRAEDIADAIVELGGPAVFEHKLDGARIQIHKDGDQVWAFSRRLTEVTESLPEAVDVGGALSAGRALVEGEAVAYDEGGRPLPFQELMRRFRRTHQLEAEAARVPVEIHLFDCLHVDGDTLFDEPLAERWARLRSIAPAERLVARRVTGDPGEARGLYDDAIEAGHEGLVAKARDSTYVPGRRGEHWLKIKPARTLDLVVLAAEWGHGRREGWLSNLHLGVRAPEEDVDRVTEPDEAPSGPVVRRDGWAMVGKTFKGMTDEELEEVTGRLLDLAVQEPDWGVVARPELVVEVDFDEVQASPHYDSGYALRFARVKAIRDDKPADEAARLSEIAEAYEAQGQRKGSIEDG